MEADIRTCWRRDPRSIESICDLCSNKFVHSQSAGKQKMTPEIPFKRQVVEPVQCLKNGWELVKDQYWLFVGMAAVAVLIGGAVPLGILLGPMMCGQYLTFFKKRRGEPIEFGTLFKGFDFFGPSLVATLLHIVPILAVVIPAYFLFYISMIVSMTAASQSGGDPNPAALFGVMGAFGLFLLVVFVVIIFISSW